jgi:hypothetical protein
MGSTKDCSSGPVDLLEGSNATEIAKYGGQDSPSIRIIDAGVSVVGDGSTIRNNEGFHNAKYCRQKTPV